MAITKMIQTYIFDLEDTIIDKSIYARIYTPIIESLLENLKISEIELQEVISKLKKETGKEKIDTFALCKKLNSTELYYKVLTRYVKHTFSLKTKNISKIFKKIKASKKKIGIVSKSEKRTIEVFLKRFNLLDLVDFIESGNKDTVLFWVLLEKKYKIDKESTLVIDDSNDILDIAEHAGYNVLNVKDLDNLDKFEY